MAKRAATGENAGHGVGFSGTRVTVTPAFR